MKLVMAALSLLVLGACQSAHEKFPQRYALDEASYSVTESSEILIVYVGARNCPPCLRFKTRDYPVWIESEEYGHVRYWEIDFPRFQRTDEDRYWPVDLRRVREKAYVRRGAPRWIIAVNRRIVSNQRGWNSQTYPLIQRLVARKLEG